MGSHKSKNQRVDINLLPVVEPEPNYQIKTRQPMPANWYLNILRGQREDELRGLAYAYSRRKCHKNVNELLQCEKKYGSFWAAFDCQEENYYMKECLAHEYEVEMDKMRRNMKMNSEWWWRDLYDENGEVGEQAEWVDEYWLVPKVRNIRDTFYSIFFKPSYQDKVDK